MSILSFQKYLDRGLVGESLIARWLRRRGFYVLPAYEVAKGNYAGPRLYTPQSKLIVPDMLIFNRNWIGWGEAKNKSAFSYYRKKSLWQTGIDIRCYKDYCQIIDETPWPILLMFLQWPGQAKDSPPGCPTGLFGGNLADLRERADHEDENEGMVYWNEGDLKKVAELEDLTESLNSEIAGSERAGKQSHHSSGVSYG